MMIVVEVERTELSDITEAESIRLSKELDWGEIR